VRTRRAVEASNHKSGNGRDPTAADPAAQPTMRRNAVNGRAAIEFDGVR